MQFALCSKDIDLLWVDGKLLKLLSLSYVNLLSNYYFCIYSLFYFVCSYDFF